MDPDDYQVFLRKLSPGIIVLGHLEAGLLVAGWGRRSFMNWLNLSKSSKIRNLAAEWAGSPRWVEFWSSTGSGCPPVNLGDSYDKIGIIRGVIKKLFFTLSKQTEIPLPLFLTTSVFSDKDFLDWARPCPPIHFLVKNGHKW